jgi:hypothetical protein
MIGKNQIINLAAVAGVAVFSGVSSAQLNNPGAFAMSLNDALSGTESRVQGPVFEIKNSDFEGQTGSFLVTLNQSNSNTGLGLDGMGSQDGYDNANRGQFQSGIDASRLIEPKEDINIVPLPTGAIAGFGVLAAIAGIRFARKSR